MSVFGKLPAWTPPADKRAFAAAVKARALAGDCTRDGAINALWSAPLRYDTYAIAKKLMLRESFVANRLAAIRDEVSR